MPEHSLPHPSLEVVGGGRDSFLPALKTLNRPYDPYPVIGWNRHLETIFAAFFRSLPDVILRRQCLRTKDDGSVALDWVSGDDTQLPPHSPVLILLPGLTGGSGDTYVRHMLLRARKKGWRVLVFNSRGCGDSPVTTSQFYSASFTEDLREVVTHVGTQYPEAKLYAAGWSLGANILVRYLGQESHTCPLSGAVFLCNPFNLVTADEDFHKGFNNVYDKALINLLRKIFKHAFLFEDMGGDYNIPLAANARTVREFDEGIIQGTSPLILLNIKNLKQAIMIVSTIVAKKIFDILDENHYYNSRLQMIRLLHLEESLMKTLSCYFRRSQNVY